MVGPFLSAGARVQRVAAAMLRRRWPVLDDLARISTAVVLLAVPWVLSVVDHHAVERVPGHAHAALDGAPVPTHVHGFEVPHVDRPAPQPTTGEVEVRWSGSQVAIVGPSALAGPLLSALQAALAALALGLMLAHGSSRAVRSSRSPVGLLWAPPTGPPRRVLLFPAR